MRRLAVTELKTKKTAASVEAFLRKVADPKQREDCFTILKMMKDVTRLKPKMWGTSMVGFGSTHYKYASGHEGDCFITGFSPRKGKLSIHIMAGCARYGELLRKLGKHKTGVSCLYVKKLGDIDLVTLGVLVKESFEHTCKQFNVKKARKDDER
jgi:hypothetical protein